MGRDSRMVIRADAKAMGAVTAHSVRVNDRWQGSGTKSGECVSIFTDENGVETRIPFVRTRSTPATRLAAVKTAKRDTAQDYADRLRIFGAIGNGDTD